MKKYILTILSIIICVLCLMGCSFSNLNEEVELAVSSTADYPASIMVNDMIYLLGQAILAEVDESAIIGYTNSYTDSFPSKNGETNFNRELNMPYAEVEGGIAVLYENEWYLCTPKESNKTETITYNGKEYLKSELCDATLHWLELSEQERMYSSYLPPEFMIFEETWGITLAAENVTPEGLKIKCTQSAGGATGELQTGSWYIVENWTKENGWKEIPYVIEGEISWTAEAWIIPMNDTCEWEVNWNWLYGSLPAGKYRIGKDIMDFRETGNYDNSIYFVEFEITD